ncbi:MAG: hypothetical protein IPM85_09500 [Chitinophagaceae bacterium]|nr:hypothetical protein [Chitinophagaceae bacterium]
MRRTRVRPWRKVKIIDELEICFMPEWLGDLFYESIHCTIRCYLWAGYCYWYMAGRIKIAGISLGIPGYYLQDCFFLPGHRNRFRNGTFYKGIWSHPFVYAIGLQVGPGFWASLKKNAMTNNLLAFGIVATGVFITVLLYLLSNNSISVMAGVMSGAVTNTPGLAAAQAAVRDMDVASSDRSLITLAYAVAYPLGVFGIIGALLILKRMFKNKH